MKYTGNLLKMSSIHAAVVQYSLKLGNEIIQINELIDHTIKLRWEGIINCIKCGNRTKTSFQQGFCYNCFQTAPEADPGIIRPELDQAHLGISRDMEWAKSYSLTEHVVYLAVSSGLKVGVTRASQYITRWIDQGASKAVIIARTPYRNLAGQIEVQLKKHYDDKTNWRKMLLNESDEVTDLLHEKDKAAGLLTEELQSYKSDDSEIVTINYPVMKYPQKISSINLDKNPVYEGRLTGIKGQYLLFDDQSVINIRKYSGYLLSLEI